MGYNPPRDQSKSHTRKGDAQHTVAEDKAFLKKRVEELRRQRNKLDVHDRAQFYQRGKMNINIQKLEQKIDELIDE